MRGNRGCGWRVRVEDGKFYAAMNGNSWYFDSACFRDMKSVLCLSGNEESGR